MTIGLITGFLAGVALFAFLLLGHFGAGRFVFEAEPVLLVSATVAATVTWRYGLRFTAGALFGLVAASALACACLLVLYAAAAGGV